ncbi:ribonucleoside-triphosphate reductase, adenosylcobalamin-dependent [Nodularia spumigena CS-590/02]|uniref:ribonucleoside-triphosphate reductase, adenosylcobalamin-dependent n=1 Tax=Nodularia spumigena TaxID=70799 RepID=UPI00232BC3C0|nr:ribonucleoside-triphosphate reductase, adenosylcobalamin-dependent [Nodularia spumigena]MDB9326698.1 ribonucleoside-triphosphate reductase, adenosylcobalamin-dependent [Nodularia spumigena CS-590/02]
MVRELERKRQSAEFPETAPAANPVFFRTYSRRTKAGLRETWEEVCDRTIQGIIELGKLNPAEIAILENMQRNLKALPSGRWLWVGGTEWISKPKNFSGAYNCTSTNLQDWNAFGLMMDLAMMGCGTGAVIEPQYINQLPPIRNYLNVTVNGEIGSTSPELRREYTQTEIEGNNVIIHVGDSREGWVESYKSLLELSTDERFTAEVEVVVDLSDVRQSGETLKGFGGVANPIKLPGLYQRCVSILNKARGRQLNSVECCLLIDQAAVTIVAGNIRRSAGIRQFVSDDEQGATAKDNLWQQDENGNWRIDPERDALRMANHSRVFHHKPTLEECVEAVRKQYYSGEGAIQWAGEAVARSNCDLLPTQELKVDFLKSYEQGTAKEWLQAHYPDLDAKELEHRLARYGLNPCITADTWIHTELGARQVKDLIGKQLSVYVNGELFSTTTDGFWLTGVKPVFKVITQEGYELRLTGNHQLLKVTALTQKKQYTEWVETQDLHPGDSILVHNHRGVQPWESFGTFEQGWLLGSLIGDGSLAATQWGKTAYLRYWEDTQDEMGRYAVTLLKKTVDFSGSTESGCYHQQLKHRVINSSSLARLAAYYDVSLENKIPTDKIEQASYEFYRGFLRGLFDADGSVQGNQQKGVSVRLAQSNLETLKRVQRMLSRLGIISTIYQERRPESYRHLPDSNREPALYLCQAQHELVIANDNISSFLTIVGFQEPKKAARLEELCGQYKRQLNRERFSVKITEIVPDGVEAVYDCTVPGVSRFDANGIVAHNCGEIIGSNFHCVSGDTLLITRDGIHKIEDVVGCEVEIWNGEKWSQVKPFQTSSDSPLYRVRFGDGTYLDVTEYHRFFVKDRFGKTYKEVQTKDLMDTSQYSIHTEPFTIQYDDGLSIDLSYAYTLGVAVGDGTTDQNDNAKIRLYGKKAALSVAGNKSASREYDYLPSFTDATNLGFSGEFLKSLKTNPEALNVIASWNRIAILHFLAGLADTDGSNTNSNGIRIYISDYERAYRVQLLLTKCGIRSSLNLCAHQGAVTNYGVRSKDLYYLQITDCGEIPCQRLDVSKGTNAKCKGKWQVVKGVEQLPGLHNTYCFNEPEYHKGVFGNTLTGNCNLAEIHLNQIDPKNYKEQEEAFTAGAISVAALLNHKFLEPRYQYSRELDPIVGVSFTGLFDFFVHAFGVDWLHWWSEGRPETPQGLAFKQEEQKYLTFWKDTVHRVVWEYCDRHQIKRPNRCTTVQPSGTKSLLTGASSGWHPPKAQRFIRRITFGKNDPVALACIDYGYSVIPSQSDKDEQGNLLNDPFDPRVSEWLVEIPVAVSWADVPGADQIDVSQFSVLAQFDFVLQVQRWYVTHNTSATLELRSEEVEGLGQKIYETIQNDEGYISAALLARFDDLQSFPRLPFEPIDKLTYERLTQEVKTRRKTDDFCAVLSRYDSGELTEAGPSGCDSDKCMFPDQGPMS